MSKENDWLKTYNDIKRKTEVNKILSNLPVMRSYFCPICVAETIFIRIRNGVGMDIIQCAECCERVQVSKNNFA
jgi:hypothetical protein